MKKLIILLLVTGMTGSLLEAKQDFPCHTKNICCHPKPLPAPEAYGVIKITESGAYNLTEDITADICIKAHDVCLDLNCFTLTGAGFNQSAIEGTDLNNVIIKNGTIKNPGANGIELLGCNQILLEKLTLNPVETAIVIDASNNNLTTNGCLKDIDVSGNSLTTSDSLIRITNGHTFSLTCINASDCLLDRFPGPSFPALVGIAGVDNVTISCCKINNNECKDDFPFGLLAVGFGDTISVENTEVNDNKVTSPNSSAGMSNASFAFGKNYCIKHCQFNNATVNQSTLCYGLSALLITDLLIEGCEANGTTLKTAEVGTGQFAFISGATGILVVGSYFPNGDTTIRGFKILNCEANNTTHLNNLPVQSEYSGPEGIMLLGAVQGTVEKCQTNGTKSLGQNNLVAFGTSISYCFDVLVCNCEARNSRADAGIGFGIIAPNEKITVSNSIGSDNNGLNVAAGFATLLDSLTGATLPNKNVTFKNDCAQNNHAPSGYGYIFALGTEDCFVIDSLAQGNTTAGIQIGLPNLTSIHLNPKILRNCTKENGAGIVLDATANSSTIDNPLLFENKALKNTNCGFQELGNVTNPTYLGNKAQGNGTDFCPPSAFTFIKKKEGKLSCKDRSHECDSGTLSNLSVCPKHTPQP